MLQYTSPHHQSPDVSQATEGKCKNNTPCILRPIQLCARSHIQKHTHVHRLICTPGGQLSVNGLLGELIFFLSARPQPVSLFDLVGCYPAKPAHPFLCVRIHTQICTHTKSVPPPVPLAASSGPINAPSF